jgi:hypothetical protein
MARQKMELVTCDRCKRPELQTVLETPKTEPLFEAVLAGDRIRYDDLCVKCKNTVANLFSELKEWERERTALVKVDGFVAPPVSVPPTYTPPKPHSAAAITKQK